MSACFNQPTCVQTLTDYKKLAQAQGAKGAASAISSLALQGKNGWTTQLGDTFKDIPVTLIGGNRFVHPVAARKCGPTIPSSHSTVRSRRLSTTKRSRTARACRAQTSTPPGSQPPFSFRGPTPLPGIRR